MAVMKKNGAVVGRRSAVAMAFAGMLLVCAAAGWSQSYYEASGRTVAFKLTAGAKGGPAAVHYQAANRPMLASAVNFALVKGSLMISLSVQRHGAADIAIYTLTGRQAYRQGGFSGSVLRLDTHKFAPGIYNACVRIDGVNYSGRFALGR